jgi:hypothetical protein
MIESDLKKQIEQLTPPKRRPSEERKNAEAKTAVERLYPDAIRALRHLEKHGTLVLLGGSTMVPAPEGMNIPMLRGCLNACVAKDLVTLKQAQQFGSGTTFPMYEEIYTIAPGMKDALLEVLYPPES